MSCGCATVNTDEIGRAYGPEAKGRIQVELTLGSPGVTKGDVFVISNAPSSPDRLSITGVFRPKTHVEVVPRILRFQGLELGQAFTRTVTVEVLASSNADIRVAGVEATGGMLEASVSGIDSAEGASLLDYHNTTIEVEARVRCDEAGPFRGEIVMQLDPPVVSEVRIPFEGEISGKLECVPDAAVMVFSDAQQTGSPVRVLKVESRGLKSPFLRRLDNPLSEWLDVDVQVPPDGEAPQVTITGRYAPVDARMQGTITLILGLPTGPDRRLEIPVTVIRYGLP